MALGGSIANVLAFGDSFRPASNIASLNLLNQLNALNRELMVHQLRVATGRQQPRLEDGPSFFVLQNKMRNQVRGKAMALDNIGDAKDQLSVAEAGLLRVDDLLSQMRDLMVRGANDTLNAEQRDDVNREIRSLAMAIDEIVGRTQFNETGKLLDGTFKATYLVGPNESDALAVTIGDFDSESLGVKVEDANVLSSDNARKGLNRVDHAINQLKDQLIELGGLQTKLTGLENILSASLAAEESQASRFGDADLAREQLEIARLQILQQLVTSSAAAANAAPVQLIGGLLGGG